MSEAVRAINEFFKYSLKKEVDDLQDKLSLSERQEKIFCMFYIKRHDINFIADMLNVCPQVVSNELYRIRRKIIKAMDWKPRKKFLEF